MIIRRVLPILVVLLAACGSSDGPDDSASGDGATTSSSAVSQPGEADSAGNGLPEVDGAFAEGRTPVPGFAEVEVRIVPGPDGEPVVICVLVADSAAQRARGLMEVTDLGGYDGMLFRFPADSEGGFWMKDTILPLSIAYLDAEGAVVSTADMEPCPPGTSCPSYPADGPYRMALEVAQGGLERLGLTRGSPARLEVGGACAPLPDGT